MGLPYAKLMKGRVYCESGLNLSSQVDMILYRMCILMGLELLWAVICLLRCLRDMRIREKKGFFKQLSVLSSRKLYLPGKFRERRLHLFPN